MAGLLDNILGSSFDDPKTAATLMLAQGLLTSPKAMQGLSGGLLGYQNAMAEAKKAKQMEEMRQMQVQQKQMAMEQARHAQAKQTAIEQAYRGALRTPEQMAMAKHGGPTVAAAGAAQGMAPGLDKTALIQGLMQADPMAAAQMLQPKQAKIKDYKEIRMPDGSVQIVGFDEFGKPVDTGRTPFKAEEVRDFGGHMVGVDPITGKARKIGDKSQSPDSKASNALGWANYGLAGERLKLDKESAGGLTYEKDAAGNIVALPKRPTMAGPVQAIPVRGLTNPGQKDAGDALALIQQARELIPKATSSAVGAGVDMALGAFGASTQSADNASKLRALEGALVAKMPKMSGPQSDKDVAMYRQMAGEIGSPMTPASRRMAALDEIERIQLRYSGAPASSPASSGLKFLGFE
jgi:hypothetical protein